MPRINILLVIFFIMALYRPVHGEIYFVDYVLTANCTNGKYDVDNRSCGSETAVNAYKSISEGIAAMVAGDTLMIRKGSYEESEIRISFSGTATIIQAYQNEAVTIHNPYQPTSKSDGKATFYLNNSASNITFRDLILTGTKSAGVDEDYGAIAIGQASGTPGNLITIDNCQFSGFAHCAIKGQFKWWIKNCRFNDIGTDWHDHHIYSTGQQSAGNEAIIENSYFGSCAGAALHLYKAPSYHIVRYNIINGGRAAGNGLYWGILLSGSRHKIYGNTIYDCYKGLTLYKENCKDNEIKNNLFSGNIRHDLGIDFGGESYPFGNIVSHNFFGSTNPCVNCKDMRGDGGDDYTSYSDSPNIISSENQFNSASPSKWSDFRLANSAIVIDSGNNLGAQNNRGLNPLYDSWPATTADQNEFGDGWDIGAFIAIEAIGSQPLLSPPQNLRVIRGTQ